MHYRDAMAYTITWTDGYTWTCSVGIFGRLMTSFGALDEVVLGIAPIRMRLQSLANVGSELPVDQFAPTEDDRAVLTAALGRCLEDLTQAQESGSESTEIHEEGSQTRYVEALTKLHEFFQTDVTRDSA
jgi:hypothetical protein